MTPGAFIWYDLATTDTTAATRFYAEVIGWNVEPIPEKHYTVLKAGEERVAGLMALPPHLHEAGVPPHWSGYILVDDVDAMSERVKAAGGTLRFGPEDIPDIGRFAVVADPDGAHFYLFKPLGSGEGGPAPMTLGTIGWRELYCTDHTTTLAFYRRLFGWEPSQAIDMGPMGTYQLFSYGGADRGGMMNSPPGVPPHWQFYIFVDSAAAAKARIEAAGGQVLRGPQEVPGPSWVILARDPQGAAFACVSATP